MSECATIQSLLLRRSGLIFLPAETVDKVSENVLRAVEIKFAELGYVFSTPLRRRLLHTSLGDLTNLQQWAWSVLAEQIGGEQKHEPLFRRFPNDIPDDTFELWIRKVLSHFLQEGEQPCLFCKNVGTTHVLGPCLHVVCDRCFDGSNYSACPVCERHVDAASPFFKPSDPPVATSELVQLKLLDLASGLDAHSERLFSSLCERKQALSPADKDDFKAIIKDLRVRVLEWLPEKIPVKENVAEIFGALFLLCEPDTVLPSAKNHLATATDVLRLIAVYSGADPSLQTQTVLKSVERRDEPRRFWGKIAALVRAAPPGPTRRHLSLDLQINRFKVARLRRPLRKALFAVLEGFAPDALVEDMLRHRSYWVWVGQFLHPHEYSARFPNVARAFAVVRGKAPDGTPAPAFASYYSKLHAAVRQRDVAQVKRLLLQRPGELARRYDHALRLAATNEAAQRELMQALEQSCPSFATPVLLTLFNHLPKRLQSAKIRIYWPKGGVAKGVSAPDERLPLTADVVAFSVGVIRRELLRRFSEKPRFGDVLIDECLKRIPVPFNERTASRSAICLPRGSRVQIPDGKSTRLFLHWCQPERSGYETDIDLSVGFYGPDWRYAGVCSYYQLKFTSVSGSKIAVSSGDLRDAPFPDGATEFVDFDRAAALQSGLRYAVMVVNNYAGMPFGHLERAFAGLMVRNDLQGQHFDPRTVQLKFAMQGANGIYLPLVVDMAECTLHWLDTYSKGKFEFNNVETSKASIAKICPEMMEYFESGVRASMYDLALLHAAARGQRVTMRGFGSRVFVREANEDAASFHYRLTHDIGSSTTRAVPLQEADPILAILYRGDIALPANSASYVLFREQVNPTLSASDLLS